MTYIHIAIRPRYQRHAVRTFILPSLVDRPDCFFTCRYVSETETTDHNVGEGIVSCEALTAQFAAKSA